MLHPHVIEADHQERIPREAQAHDVEQRGELLVGLRQVDVLQQHERAGAAGKHGR